MRSMCGKEGGRENVVVLELLTLRRRAGRYRTSATATQSKFGTRRVTLLRARAMGDGDDPGGGEQLHPLLVRLDEAITHALVLQTRRADADTAVNGEEEGATEGVGEVDSVERSDNDDGSNDALDTAAVVRALCAALEHGLKGNRCVPLTHTRTPYTCRLAALLRRVF